MSCSNGRVNPDQITKLRLFSDSGGFCQNPSCLQNLFKEIEGEVIHVAEMAHIISAANDGPRANSALSDEEKAEYSNLILLCPTCHTQIDKADKKFPEDMILGWKASHKTRLQNAFGIVKCASRNDARQIASRFFRENKFVFEKYGPMTDERYNPESSLPNQWATKVREVIIPNNRKLLILCDVNLDILTKGELGLLEEFRQHVLDLEERHISNKAIAGIQYPEAMDNLFLGVG